MTVNTPPIDASEARPTSASGSRPPKTVLGQVSSIAQNQLELILLEGSFEAVHLVRRLIAVAICSLLGLTAYVLVQVGIVHLLVVAGLPLWGACFALVAFYALLSVVVFKTVGHRDGKAGRPFQASRDEWKRSVEWIHKRFF